MHIAEFTLSIQGQRHLGPVLAINGMARRNYLFLWDAAGNAHVRRYYEGAHGDNAAGLDQALAEVGDILASRERPFGPVLVAWARKEEVAAREAARRAAEEQERKDREEAARLAAEAAELAREAAEQARRFGEDPLGAVKAARARAEAAVPDERRRPGRPPKAKPLTVGGVAAGVSKLDAMLAGTP